MCLIKDTVHHHWSTFALLCNRHHHPPPQLFEVLQLQLYLQLRSIPMKRQLPPHVPQPLAPTILFPVSMNLTALGVVVPHVSGIIQYLSFCPRLTSLHIMYSRSIHIIAFVSIPFFLKLNDIPWYVFTTSCLSIHQWTLDCFQLAVAVNNVAVKMGVQIYLQELSTIFRKLMLLP